MKNLDLPQDFEMKRMAVPEELGERLEEEVARCRHRIEECTAQLAFMKAKPRDFSAMEGQDNAAYWANKHLFYDGIDDIELNILDELFRNLDQDPGSIRSLDLGMGTGRSAQVALAALRGMDGVSQATRLAFAKEIHGVELDPGNVKTSRQNLGPHGVPAVNIQQGNFMEPFPEDMHGKFDVVWMMMNGMSYANTESRAMSTIRNIEDSLTPGGVFLFDSVQTDYLTDEPDQETLRHYLDLMNFHSNLARMYNAEHLHANPDPQRLRFHVFGSTAVTGNPDADETRHPDNGMILGANADSREMIGLPYFNHLLTKMGSKLKPVGTKPAKRVLRPIEHKAASAIGMRWMQQNGMEPYLRAEIAHRVAYGGRKLTSLYVQPHIFQDPKAAEELGLDLHSGEVDRVLRELVAPGMVNTYTKEYCFFRKAS